MASSFSYFHQGHKKARKYCSRSLGNRIIASLFQPISLLGSLSILFTAPFTASNFAFNYMLREADDAILEKSFDGAENGKGYLTSIVISGVCLGIIASIAGLIVALYFVISNALSGSIPNPQEAGIFSLALLIILSVVGAFSAGMVLMVIQAAFFIMHKNRALGAGDVLYNAVRFVKKRGWRLLAIDIIHILTIALMVAPFVATSIFLNDLAARSYEFYPVLFRSIGAAVAVIGLIVYLFYGGQVLIAFRYSVYALLDDEASSTKYVVVYPTATFDSKGNKKGKFVEVVREDNDELHPLEPVSTEEKID